jgi:hypothetical protein
MPEARREFLTTSWSLVAAAAETKAPQGREALEQLCRAYWQPLVRFADRTPGPRKQPRDAEDAVQSFFAWLIETNVLERADARRGRFRTFLLAAFQQFRQREFAYWMAKKRCPEQGVASLHAEGESTCKLVHEPFHELTPDRCFDRDWALQLIDRAMKRLCEEWTRAGRLDRFQILKSQLTAGRAIRGQELARQLNLSEGAARVALFRLKQQFAAILRDEVAQTVADIDEVDQELAELRQALGES